MASTVTDRIAGVSTSVAIKAPVKAITQGNIDLSGLGVQAGGSWTESLTAGDRVLVKDQTDAVENGVYTAFSSGWRRATDFNGYRDVVKGTSVPLESTGDRYRVITENPIILGTSEINFQLHPQDARVIPVPSRTAMKAYDVPPGSKFSFEGYDWDVKSGTPPSDPQEGIYVVLDNGNYAERLYQDPIPVEVFGGRRNQGSSFDNAPFIEASLNLLGYVKFQSGTYHTEEVTVPSGVVVISGEGDGESIVHFLSATNSNGFNAALSNDKIIVRDLTIQSSKVGGVFTQAITAVNPNSVNIFNVSADGFSQFTVSIRLQQDNLFEEILVDNLTVTGAGNTDNGVNNCFEIFAANFDAATKRTIVKNSSFTTDSITKGNIAKFANSLFGVVENCTFTCASRDGTSASSGIELGASSNLYTYSGSNFKFKDVSVSDNATTGLKSLAPRCEFFNAVDCDFDSGPFIFDNQASELKFTRCSFDTILAGGTTTNVGLMEFNNCTVSAYDLDDSASLVFDEIRVNGGSVTTRFQNRNSTTSKLIIDGTSFPLAANEHYVLGSSVCHVKNCSVYEGPSSASATNTFIAYTDAEFSNNEVDTGANRQYIFTVANGASVEVRHSGVKKSDAGAPTFLGVISGTITGFSNVVNGVLT